MGEMRNELKMESGTPKGGRARRRWEAKILKKE
jgi:hypothetical protein